MRSRHSVSRRQFLTGAAGTAVGVIGFPYIINSSVLGSDGNVAPSERITMGCIGVGWQGGSNMEQFLGLKDCRIVAICDVDKRHLQGAVNAVNKRYGSQDCAAYGDYRELIARDDIDAVSLGRKIRFNPENEEIIGDPTATQMLGREYRSPWHL